MLFTPKKIVWLLLLYTPLYMNAQNAAQYSSDIAVKYYNLSLQLIKTTPGFSPPVASRALGYTGLTLYESVVSGIPTYQSADGILNGLGPNAITDPTTAPYHYPTVVNNALAMVIDSLYANTTAANKTLLNNLRDSLNTVYQAQTSPSIYNNSLTFGQAIATDVFNFSRTDGGHKGYTSNFPASYTAPTGAGLWEPTPPAFQAIPLQPYWGNNRPIIPATNTALVCPPPPTYDTTVGSAFYNYANEVYTTKNNATTDQQNIALYWADGGGTVTPPGHSISMLTQLIVANNENLEFAALSYAKLSMATMDAFINCWETKYSYNLLRPITYIRANIDPAWNALIATPPFPEYSSGHSSQSGAFASIMNGIYGPNYAFTDYTNNGSFGGNRTFSSFDEAAQEAAKSRLYGGIHYTFGNEAGLSAGTQVGYKINELFATQLRLSPLADAAIDVQFDVSQAAIGDTVSLTVYLNNEGLTELNNITIFDTLPSSLQFISALPDLGTYNNTTGIWNITQVAAGIPVVKLVITAKIVADGVPYNTAEIIAMDETDTDSTPNNQLLSEDDIQGGCLSVPIKVCNINYDLAAPSGYSSYQWYQSTDNGQTFIPFATTQTVNITTAGQYTFTVENSTLGTCGNQLCCPVIIEQYCCPTPACIPILVRKQ